MQDKELKAPFPYFGGKIGAVDLVWKAFGIVDNYVEPFAGSSVMLLNAPEGKRTETINDFDGFVSNFWRSIAYSPDETAKWADWPVNETDLFARHSWLVGKRKQITQYLEADPTWHDPKIAGWWCWGLCAWIGSGWCSGEGPWINDGGKIVHRRDIDADEGQGINRKLPHLGDAGRGINRQLPHLGDAGQCINRQLPNGTERHEFIQNWFARLSKRLRDVRVASGDWERVVKDSVTTRHGLTAVFLDPPYDKGSMDYGAGGMGLGVSSRVRNWCIENGSNVGLRIAICGHDGEHDDLLKHGWDKRQWNAKKGYALTDEAIENTKSETVWFSPHCIPESKNLSLFD